MLRFRRVVREGPSEPREILRAVQKGADSALDTAGSRRSFDPPAAEFRSPPRFERAGERQANATATRDAQRATGSTPPRAALASTVGSADSGDALATLAEVAEAVAVQAAGAWMAGPQAVAMTEVSSVTGAMPCIPVASLRCLPQPPS